MEEAILEYLQNYLAAMPAEERQHVANMTLGQRLSWLMDTINTRFPRAVSLRKVARETELSPQALSLIANDITRRPSSETIERLSEVFNLPISFFVLGKVQFSGPDLSVLPKDLADFLVEPANQPYLLEALRLARTCHDLELDPSVIHRLRETVRTIAGQLADDDEEVPAKRTSEEKDALPM